MMLETLTLDHNIIYKRETLSEILAKIRHEDVTWRHFCNTRFFFYKQPVYKQLALGCENNKQLSGLACLTISNLLIWTLIKFHYSTYFIFIALKWTVSFRWPRAQNQRTPQILGNVTKQRVYYIFPSLLSRWYCIIFIYLFIKCSLNNLNL